MNFSIKYTYHSKSIIMGWPCWVPKVLPPLHKFPPDFVALTCMTYGLIMIINTKNSGPGVYIMYVTDGAMANRLRVWVAMQATKKLFQIDRYRVEEIIIIMGTQLDIGNITGRW